MYLVTNKSVVTPTMRTVFATKKHFFGLKLHLFRIVEFFKLKIFSDHITNVNLYRMNVSTLRAQKL